MAQSLLKLYKSTGMLSNLVTLSQTAREMSVDLFTFGVFVLSDIFVVIPNAILCANINGKRTAAVVVVAVVLQLNRKKERRKNFLCIITIGRLCQMQKSLATENGRCTYTYMYVYTHRCVSVNS